MSTQEQPLMSGNAKGASVALPPTTAPADADLWEGGIGWVETLGMSLASLRANPLRTVLTALGVLIGVASVVALLAIGRGSQASITASITANGANLLTIRPQGQAGAGQVRGAVGAGSTLTVADATALANPQNVPDAAFVSPEYNGNAQLVAGSLNQNARVTGALPVYPSLHNTTLAEGVFISEEQNVASANVAVLGANVAANLFTSSDALGQQVRINGQSFQVIGVLAPSGGTGFGSIDDGLIVPLNTAQHKLFGARAATGGSFSVSTIVVQAASAAQIDPALNEINTLLRQRNNLPPDGSGDTFSVINQAAILATVTQTTQMLTLFLAAIAAISLLVGGIGIMNIMLVSVRERTREIGLRKALGARESDIMLQFLFESLALSGVGGLIGLAIGSAIAIGVSISGVFQAQLSPDAALMAIGFALAVGLFFGIAPARSAARLDPIVALRYE